ACAHPAIDPGIRAPLILQTILGFDAAAIASAFLVAPAAMGQRLVRAKHKIRRAGIPLRVPGRGELAERLGAVLDAVYAAFAEGWSDPAGPDARLAPAGGAGGAGAVGAHAPCRGAPQRAPRRRGRLCPARSAGPRRMGR